MSKINQARYLAIVHWASMRWAVSKFERFKDIERRAAARYLGMA